MPRIHSPVGDFDFKLTFTNPSDSSTKDTENDDLKPQGGSLELFRNGDPARMIVHLDLTTDAKWIDELFLVDFETKGTGEGTWLNRFSGKVYSVKSSEANLLTLVCLDRSEDRLNRVSLKDRYFYYALVDSKKYNVYYGAMSGWPPEVRLDADVRPQRPLIQAEALKLPGIKVLRSDDGIALAYMDADYIRGNQWRAQEILIPSDCPLLYEVWLYILKTGSPPNNLVIDIVEPDPSDIRTPSTNIVYGSTKSIAPGSVTSDPGAWLKLVYTDPLSVSPGTKYFIRVRTIGGDSTNQYWWGFTSRPQATLWFCSSTDGGSTWTPYTGQAYYWLLCNNNTQDYFRKLVEEVDFSVDYPNKKINFDRDFVPQSHKDYGTDEFGLFEDVRLTYFKGYHTIGSIVEKLYDDFLSKDVPAKSISPTDAFNLAPFSSKEGPALHLLQEVLKLGPFAMRLYKNTAGNLQFDFLDAYKASDWGSSPFTGAFANNRTLYHGDDISAGQEDFARIVNDGREKVTAKRFNSFNVFNFNARLLIGATDPSDKATHGLLSSDFLHAPIADSIDELVSLLELLFQYNASSRIGGRIVVDRISMTTTNAMFTHCNDLVYIKDTRQGYDGAHVITKISLDLKSWLFTLDVVDKVIPVKFDKLAVSGQGFATIPEYADFSGFKTPQKQPETLGEWLRNTILVLVDTSALTYNSSYTYKIGVGDSDASGSSMQNELANVDCEVNESTSKIHTLDVDGDAVDEYRLAVAILEFSDFSSLASWPVIVKEVGLYNGATLLKRLVLKVPWPASPAPEDFFHPQPVLNEGGKLFVCWIITT